MSSPKRTSIQGTGRRLSPGSGAEHTRGRLLRQTSQEQTQKQKDEREAGAGTRQGEHRNGDQGGV